MSTGGQLLEFKFKKNRASFGMFIIGGNRVGHYVHKVEPMSLASNIGLQSNDRLIKIQIQKSRQVMTIPFKKISHEEALLLLKSLPLDIEMRIVVERDGRLPPYQKLLKSPDCFYIKATADFRPPPKIAPAPKTIKSISSISSKNSTNSQKTKKSSKNSCCDTNSGSSHGSTSSSDETSNSREMIFGNPGSSQTSRSSKKALLEVQNTPKNLDVSKFSDNSRNFSNITETTEFSCSGSSGSSGYHRGASDDSGKEDEDEWFYINKGDIFQVTHTHYKKSEKKWRATKIHEPHRILNDKIVKMGSGVIPSGMNFGYERVCLRKPQFKRPIVIFSPFYEVITEYLKNDRHNKQFRNVTDLESVNPANCERLLFNHPENLLADIIKHDDQHSMLSLSMPENLEKFNKITGLYPICICVRSAYWEHVEKIFTDSKLEFPDNVISRIEFCMNIEYELDDRVIVVDVEGDELHAWKEEIVTRIREEQKKYVWIAHDNSDVVMPVESLNRVGKKDEVSVGRGGESRSRDSRSRDSRSRNSVARNSIASTATKAHTMI